jgi:phage-related protein
LGPKVDEQIKAMQRLGITDDEVRDGLEVGSRFFKNQNNLLKANAVAANISAATGKPLAAVMLALGKGAQGSTRGLASLGIEVEKGAKLQDILTAANEKYKGVADEIANSTAGKFAAAQIDLNEKFEEFGAKFLPAVNEALGFFTNEILPMVTPALDTLGDIIFGVAEAFAGKDGIAESIGKVVGPILDDLKPAFEDVVGAVDGVFKSVGDLIGALWGDGEGALAFAFKALGLAIEAAFAIAKPFFDALKWLIDNITAVVNALNKVSTPEAQAKRAAAQEVAADSTVFGMGRNTGGGGFTANLRVDLDGKTIAQSTDSYLGRQAQNSGNSRLYP